MSGLPRYSNGQEVGFKRSTNFGANWNRQETTNDGFFADFTHAFNDDWRFKLSGAYVKEKQYLKYSTSSRAVNPVTQMALVNAAMTHADIDTSGLDANQSRMSFSAATSASLMPGLRWSSWRATGPP